MAQQLILPLQFDDSASFENYFVGDNGEAVTALKALPDTPKPRSPVYLWGAPGCGRTHLLHALCRRAEERDRLNLYLPLRDPNCAPFMLEHLNPGTLVGFDDLEAVASVPEWERALLTLYERIAASSGAMVVTAEVPPAQLKLVLPDFSSRLAGGSVYRLAPLDDKGRVEFLQLRATERGLVLSEEVINFIMSRYRRDTQSLFSLLDRIDNASLAAGRRVTIPFIKQYL